MLNPNFPLHYETGTHPKRRVFLPDDDFCKALDCLVKACTDLLLVDDETGEILLGERKVHPQPSWWFGCGGRMVPGETPFESACRLLKREIGLVIEPKHESEGGRFQGVGAYSYAWQYRQQSPQDGGLADVSLVLTLRVTKKERDMVRLDYSQDKEYSQHAWVRPEVVCGDETKHPALRRAVADLMAGSKWRKFLKEAPALSDAELGKRLRESGLLMGQ